MKKTSEAGREPFWWAAAINSMISGGQSAKAIAALDRLMDQNVDRRHALLYKVRLLRKLGRLKEAIAWVCLEAVLRPDDPQILALQDEMMAVYPYSLFERQPDVDLFANFKRMDDEWPDVAGMQEIKIQLYNDLILPIRHPEKFKRFGVEMPNGVLFYGPPGCGKTYLARRLAEKIEYKFYEARISHLGSPYIHQMAVNIGKMFKYAADNRPMVLFLDEIDSLGGDRAARDTASYRIEEVNELLKQLDRCHERGTLVVGACNAIDRVDPALRRPGRFDRQIFVSPPDAAARRDLFQYFLKSRPVAESIQYKGLVERSDGHSNADIEAVVKDAARRAAIEDAQLIGQRHLESALDAIPSSIQPVENRSSKKIGFSPAGPA